MSHQQRTHLAEPLGVDGPGPGASVRVLGAATPVDAGGLAELRHHVEQGGALLVLARPGDGALAALTGTTHDACLPRAEWIVALGHRAEADRLDRETALVAPLHGLRALADDVHTAATTSAAFRTVAVLAVRTVGRGRVVSAAVADASTLLDHPVLGPYTRRLLEGGAAPTRTLGVAVVGYGPFGGMGYTHGLAATETPGLAFVGAVDPQADRRAAAQADFPDVRTYAAATGLAGDDAVDIAIVATPPVHHAELAIELLRAGKHVVVEKPMCLTVADADRMLRAADAAGRTLTVHQSRRWDTDVLALTAAIDRGVLGDVFNIETFVGGFEHPCRAWHSEESVSGGAVYDWGSHHIDWILRWYGGPPSHVSTTSHKHVWRDVTNADQVTVWMRWPDGREATFRQSDLAAVRRPKFFVQGTAGTAEGHYRPLVTESVEPGRGHVRRHAHHAEAPVDLRVVRYESGTGLVSQTIGPAPSPGWGFHRNLADHLLLGEPLAVPPQQSRAVVAVLEAAQRAGSDGFASVDLGAVAW